MNEIAQRNSLITLVRGKGLLNAIVIDCDEESDLAPPLVITEAQILEYLGIIEKALNDFR